MIATDGATMGVLTVSLTGPTGPSGELALTYTVLLTRPLLTSGAVTATEVHP